MNTKKAILAILIFYISCTRLQATNYYLSPGGNDLSTGLSPAQAWKSLAKLSSVKSSLLPGDSIFFERNANYYGTLEIASNGSSSDVIYIGAYGSGSKPEISGSEVLTGWTHTGNNVWECSYTSSAAKIYNLLIDGQSQQLARYPDFNATDGGFMPMYNCVGDTVLTGYLLSSSPNYTDAEAVIRTNRWIIDRLKIKTHLNTAITTAEKATYALVAGYGFFIQNHLSALSIDWEWYYDAAAKKMYLYASDFNPNDKQIEIASQDYVLRMDSKSYVTFQNLQFNNSNKCNVYITNGSNLTITDCEVNNAGVNGVIIYNVPYTVFLGNLVQDVNNNGVNILGNYAQVTSNTVKRIALRQGMGSSGNGNYNGVTVTSYNGLVQYNTLDSIGYNGLSYGRDLIRIMNNTIRNVCMVKDDGGAIYSWNNSAQTVFTDIRIENNIIINPAGNSFGTNSPGSSAAEGIYSDDAMNHTTIRNNVVVGATDYGLYLHNTYAMTVEGNTFYGNKTQVCMKHDALSANNPLRNIIFRNNTLVNTVESQRLLHLQTRRNDLDSIGTFESNYYIAPFKGSLVKPFYTQHVPGFPVTTTTQSNYYYPDQWIAGSGKDADSKLSPRFYNRYTVDAYTGDNKVTNGDFTTDITNWTSWGSDGSGKSWISEGIVGGSISLYFPAGSTSPYVELNGAVGELTANSYYKLTFDARAANPNTYIEVRFLKNGTPYTLNTLLDDIPVGTTAQSYEYIFQSMVTESNSRITFRLYAGDGALELDNIVVRPVRVTASTIADSLLLNINETQSSQQFTLTGEYVDKTNVEFTDYLTVAPYSAKVLLKNTAGLAVLPNILTINGNVNSSELELSGTSQLEIVAGAHLTADGNLTVEKVTVSPSGKLSLGTNLLAAQGGVLLQSDATGTATLTGDNAVSNATVQQHVTAGRNWYMSSPVSSAAYSTLSRGTSVVEWNEVTKAWDSKSSGTLTPGRGYIQVATSSPSVTGTTGTLDFSGTTNSGTTAINLTRTESGSSRGFNLVGNPYPSYLNWESVIADGGFSGISTTFWYRTKTTTNAYTFVTYNGTSGMYVTGNGTANTTITGKIPPMQAFWVLVEENAEKTSHGATLTYKNSMRQHADIAGNTLKVAQSDNRPRLRVQLTNGTYADETLVYFDTRACNAYDAYDSPKMMNTVANMYTVTDAMNLAINGMNNIKYEAEIPLGFSTVAAGNYSISLSEFSNFDTGTRVFIKDTLNPAAEVELTPEMPYHFSSPVTTASANRFSFFFRAPASPNGLNTTKKLNVKVFVNAANQIIIVAPENSKYAIYNVMGQLIENGKTDLKQHTVNCSLQPGFFVVKVGIQSKTIIIK